jgi:outer membrane protein
MAAQAAGKVSGVLKIRTALLAALAVPVSLVLAGPVFADSIIDAMEKAYVNNPDLNAARAGLRATDEGVTIAKAGWRPQISGSVQFTTQQYDANLAGHTTVTSPTTGQTFTDLDQHGFNTNTVALTITQQVFDGFQTLNNVREAEANVYSERASVKAKEIQTLLSAAQAYSDIARDQEIVVIRKQNIAFLNEQVKAAKARLDVGEGTKTDVSLAQAQLAQAQALVASAVFQLKQSQAVYVQIVGEAPKGIKQVKPISKQVPQTIDNAVATGWREHPQILATMYAVDAAGYKVKSAEGAMLPGVVIQGQTAYNKSYSDLTDASIRNYNSTSLTARLNVPIYQGGAEYGQIREAKERLGQQQILLDSVRLEVQKTIVSGMAQYEAAQASISANLVQLRAANEALDGLIEERKLGQATTLDVLDAQSRVLNAKENLASSQRDAVVASYAIVAAMGHLTIETMRLKVERYDPEIHYNKVKDKWFGLRTVDGR